MVAVSYVFYPRHRITELGRGLQVLVGPWKWLVILEYRESSAQECHAWPSLDEEAVPTPSVSGA